MESEPSEATEVEGACLCGAVRFRVRMPTLFCGHCHCTMCQRNHGAAFVTWFGVPKEQLSVESGLDRLVVSKSSDHGTRSFCGGCGSSLFCDSNTHPDTTDVVLAAMKSAIDRPPQAHVYYDSHVDWASADDHLPRLGGSTGVEPIKDD
jgi:hypothetical protein